MKKSITLKVMAKLIESPSKLQAGIILVVYVNGCGMNQYTLPIQGYLGRRSEVEQPSSLKEERQDTRCKHKNSECEENDSL